MTDEKTPTFRSELKRQWVRYLSEPSVRHALNMRVDLTLTQRRNSELQTTRPRDEKVTVRTRSKRLPLRDASLFAPFYYLNEDETRRIAVRLTNRLNKALFGNRARRRHNPERLTALICVHDKGTRRHLHCLFGVPPGVSLPQFRNALRSALDAEPFVYREQRLERIENLAASILYNLNDSKSLTGHTILYIHPQLTITSDRSPNEPNIQ